MAQVAAKPRPRLRQTTGLFDLTLQLPAFSSAEEICLVFLALVEHVQDNQSIHGLQDLSYSYDLPEHGGATCISRQLHASSKTSETTVQGWLLDDRIIPGNTRWTSVEPRQNGDSRQHNNIQTMFCCMLRWLPKIRALDARPLARAQRKSGPESPEDFAKRRQSLQGRASAKRHQSRMI